MEATLVNNSGCWETVQTLLEYSEKSQIFFFQLGHMKSEQIFRHLSFDECFTNPKIKAVLKSTDKTSWNNKLKF